MHLLKCERGWSVIALSRNPDDEYAICHESTMEGIVSRTHVQFDVHTYPERKEEEGAKISARSMNPCASWLSLTEEIVLREYTIVHILYQKTTHQNWSICTLQDMDRLNSASALCCPGKRKQRAKRRVRFSALSLFFVVRLDLFFYCSACLHHAHSVHCRGIMA